MIKRLAHLLALLVLSAAASGCDDGGVEGAGGAGGDPDPILEPTFANVRASVFVSCGFSSCHNEARAIYGNVIIREEDEYAQAVHDNLVGAASATDVQLRDGPREAPNVPARVVPGDPRGSFLLWKVLGHDPDDPAEPVAGSVMPLDCTKTCLSENRKELVRRWILAGAPAE